MKEFFHSWVFKVLLALCIVMFAFLLRATMTMGASTVVEQIVGTITAPVQSLTSGFERFDHRAFWTSFSGQARFRRRTSSFGRRTESSSSRW